MVLSCGKNGTTIRRVFLMGETGAGKSTLGNVLLGGGHFRVGDGYEGVTQEVQCVTGRSFGGRPLEVCDTPGLNDESKSDEATALMVASALASRPADAVVYVHNARVLRLTRAARKAMKRVVALFPGEAADRVLFAFTRATGLSAASKRALGELLCAKLDKSFCHRPPAMAFAGLQNKFIDLATFVDFRLKRQTTAFFDQLKSATMLSDNKQRDLTRLINATLATTGRRPQQHDSYKTPETTNTNDCSDLCRRICDDNDLLEAPQL